MIVLRYEGMKKPLHRLSGVWRVAHSPHLADIAISAGIGTLSAWREWVAGLHRAVSLHLS